MRIRRTPLYFLGIVLLFLGGCFQRGAPVPVAPQPEQEQVEALADPGFFIAGNPDSVQTTLEGCRNNGTITLPNGSGQFICPDAAYTSGNLGKGWNELDLVPYRITMQAGNSAPATQTYTVSVVLDNKDAGAPGYDVLSLPVLNAAKSTAGTCAILRDDEKIKTPGLGGIDESRYRLITITQTKNSTCVYDYYGRLALGSHDFPGSSLHANLANKNLGTAGIGARDVSIPVKEILPQELRKDMTATQGTDHVWNITKAPSPASVEFDDTCNPNKPKSKGVEIRIEWTKGPAQPGGAITVITNIYAKNPASRVITVNVTDDIRSGTTVLDTANSGDVDVPANTEMLVLTHQFAAPSGTTNLNDIATATYIDKVTQVPVPGNTTATASAPVQFSGPELNGSAVINDVESISGAGFSFSADSFAPAIGAFDGGYIAGTKTTSDVSWTSTSQGDSGSVTFDKTIYVNAGVSNTGTLSDTATLTGSDGFTADSDASIAIQSSAKVKLTINKTIPDILQGTETAKFTFHVKDANGIEIETPTITFTAGETSKSVVVTGLMPGKYSVTEDLVTGFAPVEGFTQDVTINLPTCAGEVTFTNQLSATAKAKVKKVTLPAGSEAGWEFTLTGPGTPPGGETVTTTDANFIDFATGLGEGNYTITETLQNGWDKTGEAGNCSFTVDYPRDAGAVFECTMTNTKKGRILVDKVTDPAGSTQAFEFTTDYSANFSLTDADAPNDSGLLSASSVAGNYSVSENVPAGWDLTSASCDDGSPVDAINLDPGETVTCTFTNTLKRGKIIVKKVTIPAGSSQSFDFTASYGNFSLKDGESNDSGPLLPFTTYSVSETVPTGWDQISAICDDGSPVAAIDLDPGETVTCTFKNKQRGKIIVRKITKPTGATTSFTFETTGSSYNGFSLTDGQSNDSGFLEAGTYTVKELVPLGWVLTGIGGSTNPNTPYDCTVTGTTSTSKGVGDLNTQTITITLKPGDTVNCIFENTGQGVTRTQGFWSTHSPLARIAWEGGTAFGHTFPGVAGVSGIGDTLICGRDVDGSNITAASSNQLMGGFWSSISKTTTNATRSALDQARMQLLQQLLAAELNASAFGSVPSSGSFAAWETALCGTNVTTIKNAQQQAASFNTNGDSGTFTPGTSADSKNARNIADKVFWNIIKP